MYESAAAVVVVVVLVLVEREQRELGDVLQLRVRDRVAPRQAQAGDLFTKTKSSSGW